MAGNIYFHISALMTVYGYQSRITNQKYLQLNKIPFKKLSYTWRNDIASLN